MSRSATEEVAALAARAAGKTLPEQSEEWRFFLAACYTLAAMFFCEQNERLTSTALPGRFYPAWAVEKRRGRINSSSFNTF